MITDLFYVGVGLVAAGKDAESVATISATTLAFIGAAGTATLTADPSRIVDVSGDVVVTAVSDESAKAKITGGSGSLLVTVDILEPRATITSNVQAYAGANSVIHAGNLTFATAGNPTSTTPTPTKRVAEAELLTGSVGLLGSGSDVAATATIDGNVDAWIADGATVVLPGATTDRGDLLLLADSIATATATGTGGNGSIGISVAMYDITASIGDTSGGTHAWVSGKVTARNLTVTAHGVNTATVDIPEIVVIGLLGAGTQPEATATVVADTTAELRSTAVVSTPTGTTALSAHSVDEASAETDGGAGSLTVAASVATLNATIGDCASACTMTGASILSGASVTTGGLSVGALGEYTVDTDMLLVSVGLLGGGGGADANSTIDADTVATATGASITATGNVTFTSRSSATATATLEGGAGGLGGAVFDGTAATLIEGDTIASITGSGTSINGANSVELTAEILGAQSKSKNTVGTGALFSMGKATSNATTDPVARAFIAGGRSAFHDTDRERRGDGHRSRARATPRAGATVAVRSRSG